MRPGLRRWWVVLAVLLMSGSSLFAYADSDTPDGALPVALAGIFFTVFLGLAVLTYVYMAMALMTIANKTGTENGWLAWIPIANIVLMLMIAKKPIWWIILFLIPIVNIIIAIMVWMGIAEARSKPNWWGVLMIVPVANLIVPGYLAWAD